MAFRPERSFARELRLVRRPCACSVKPIFQSRSSDLWLHLVLLQGTLACNLLHLRSPLLPPSISPYFSHPPVPSHRKFRYNVEYFEQLRFFSAAVDSTQSSFLPRLLPVGVIGSGNRREAVICKLHAQFLLFQFSFQFSSIANYSEQFQRITISIRPSERTQTFAHATLLRFTF